VTTSGVLPAGSDPLVSVVNGTTDGALQTASGTVSGAISGASGAVAAATGADQTASTISSGTNGAGAVAIPIPEAIHNSSGGALHAIAHAGGGVTPDGLGSLHATPDGAFAASSVHLVSPEPTSSGRSIEDALAGIGANLVHPGGLPLLLAATAGVIGIGITASRAFGPALQCAGGPTPLLFSSVRLIPCSAVQAVEGGVSTASEIAHRVGSSVTHGAGKGSSALGSVKAGFHEAQVRVGHGADALAQQRGVDGGEGAGDNRLLMQLGMMLGFGYLAFLTLWFWATRARPNARF
jgi:hypothetical protein